MCNCHVWLLWMYFYKITKYIFVEGSVQKATLSMLKPDSDITQRENEDMSGKEDQENNVKERERKRQRDRERERQRETETERARAYFPNVIYHLTLHYSVYG